MSILPVIVRELTVQARQRLTYWLRLAGGISVLGAIAAALWAAGVINRPPTYRAAGMQMYSAISLAGPGPNQFQSFGTALFGKMNLFIFTAIWLFVPLASADALSRERREGTLPLLYLTELRSMGIVVGKSFVHFLRAASLLVTMAPWLMLPLVFGGVEVRDIEMALMLDFTAVLLAQSAGLLASTIPRDWLKSAILAEFFALCLMLLMLVAHGAVLSNAITAGIPPGVKPGTPAFWNSKFSVLYEFTDFGSRGEGILARAKGLVEISVNHTFAGYVNPRWFYGRFVAESVWQQIWTTLAPPRIRAWFSGVIGLVFGAGLVLIAATAAGAWRIERSWRETPSAPPDSALQRRYFTPRFGIHSFKRRLSRALSANPIGWLQQYSTSARLIKWGWCLTIIVVEIIFSSNSDDLYGAQTGLGLVLLLALTFSATASFREELETGAFELLLVTPLRERQIILGRLRGLWQQFFPAILVYGAGVLYLAAGWHDQLRASSAWLWLGKMMTGFCTLPLIGLYFSVLRWNFFGAWLAASVVGFAPAWFARLFGTDWSTIILVQFGIAMGIGVLLERRLKSRGFVRDKRQGTDVAQTTA